MKPSVLLPLLIFLVVALSSWPVPVVLNKFQLVQDQLSILIAGVICILSVLLAPFLIFRYFIWKVDPVMYVYSAFAWTAVIGFCIALEVDGYISDYMAYYFAEGEPYMYTAYATAINYWDGTGHLLMYFGSIGLYAARKSHREVGLYWAGSLVNSLIVVVPGAVTGNHPFKLAMLMNIPYILFPVLATFKFLKQRPPQSRTFLKFKSILHRPIDLMFVLYFMAAIGVAVFRGLAVLGGNAEAMKYYLKEVEPYLTDPSNFPRMQMLVYEYFFLAYYLAAIYGLIYPGQHWMTDWSLIHAGAAAQSQWSHMLGSVHYLTAKALHPPMAGTPGLICWTINIALAVVPQLFIWRCLSQFEMFGYAYNVERAEFKQSKSTVRTTKKGQ